MQIAKLKQLTQSEVSELKSTNVDETAVATVLETKGRQGMTIVISQRKFIFDIYILSIVIQFPHKIHQTGRKGQCNYQISPSHLESLPHVRISFGSYSIHH